MAIKDLNKPALFELTITNNGLVDDSFEIYSLAGVTLKPSEPIAIAAGASKTLTLEVYPRAGLGYLSFEYKVKNSAGEMQTDTLAINIVNLEDAFNFKISDISPDSEKATLSIENKGGHVFNNIKADFSSAFFTRFFLNTAGSINSKRFYFLNCLPDILWI